MGLDVYLRWDGITEEEKQKQYTGFSVDAGNVGYLRASYNSSMTQELTILNELFSEMDDVCVCKYDFVKNRAKLNEVIKDYLSKNIDSEGLEWFVIWAKSLIDFFSLGHEKQKAELNPEVHMSG